MSSVARAGKPKASGTKAQDGGKGGHRTGTSPMGPRAAAQQAPPGLQQHGLKLLNKDAESAKASRWRFVSAQDEMHQAGTRVRAVLRDGTEFEGKFFTGDTDSARVAIYVQTVLKRGEADQAQDIEEEMILMLDDTALVSFHTLGPVKELRAGDGPGASGAGGKFETDVDISHKRSLSAGRPGAERMLERVDDSWLLGAEAQENGGGRKTVSGALTGSAGSWDQFKANERFGVKADFNEELYTTPKPKMSAEREAEAARLAREIEGETAKNVHVAEERGQHIANDMDEEDRFSGVMRGGEQRNSGYRGDARGGKRGGGGGGKAPSAYMPEPELAVRLLPSGRDGMYVPPARRQQQVTSPTEAASARADRDFEPQQPQQQPVVLPPAAPTSPKRLDKAAPQPPSSIPATPSEHIDAPKATAAPPALTPVKPHTDEKASKSSEASTATTTPASSRSSTPSFRKSLNVHAKEFVPGGVKAVTAPTPHVMTPPQPPHHPPAHQPPPHHHQPPPQQTPPPQPPPQQQSPQQQQQQPPHQPGGMPQPQMYPQQHRPPYYYPQQPGQFVPQYGMGPPRGQGGGYDSMPPPPGTVPVAAYMQQPQGRGPMGPGSPYPPGAIPMGQGPGIPGVYPQQYENPQMSGQMVMPPAQYLMQPYGNVARGYGSPVPGQMMGRGQAGQFPRGPQGQQYMGPPQAGQPVRGHYGMEQGYMGPDGQPGPLDMGGYPDSPQHMGGPGTPGLMPKDNEALSPAHMPMPPPHGHSPHGPPQYGPQAYMSRDAARGRGQRTPKADRGGRGKMLSRGGGRMGGMGRGHTGSPIPQGAGMPPHHVVSPQHGSMPSPMGPLPGPPLPAPPDMHPSALPPPQAPPLGDQA